MAEKCSEQLLRHAIVLLVKNVHICYWGIGFPVIGLAASSITLQEYIRVHIMQ
jgi:tellurite resistance protein TehA-like permease